MVLKKGYYIVNAGTLQVVSGEDAITSQEDALAAWQQVRQQTPGPDKFFVMWVPLDNFAWGESPVP